MLMKFFRLSLLSGMTAFLIACGGSGSADKNTSSLSGVVAIGTAMSNASVTLKDGNGKTETTTTDESGNFVFSNVSGFTPPLMLQVKGTVAGQSYVLHSLMTSTPALGSNTLNVTPATDAIVTQALGSDPIGIFNDAEKIKKIDPAKLSESKAKVLAALKDAMAKLNIDNVDVMSGKFTANKTGMDKLFDLLEFSSDSSTGAVKLTNKNTKATITVNADAKLSDVSTIAMSQEEASLNISGIDDFVKLLLQVLNKNDQNALSSIVDKDYLDRGKNFQKLKESMKDESTTQLAGSGYSVKKCDPSTKVCYGTMNFKFALTGVTYPAYMPIKQGPDGKWRAYGDQAPFYIEFYPLMARSETIDSNQKVIDSKNNFGFSIDFPGNSCFDCNDHKYKSSIFELSTDAGKSFSTFLRLNSDLSMTYPMYMGVDEGSGKISARQWLDGIGTNFVKFEDNPLINSYNQALAAGLVKIRITAYTDVDYKGSSVTWEPQSLAPLFNSQANVDALLKTQELSIDEKTLGTGQLKFTGKNLMDSYFSAIDSTGKNGAGQYFSYEDATMLNGVVTPSKMKNECEINLQYYKKPQDIAYEKQKCITLNANNLLINQAILIAQNAQGSRIYLSKKLQ